jgi:hypothetical protein
MTLPASGAISLGQVNTELGRGATATLGLGDSAVRSLFGVGSGAIGMYSGYGKANTVYVSLTISASTRNYNIFANRGAGYSAGRTALTLTISGGVVVGSNSISSYSLDTGSGWTAGDTITIVNNGYIAGMGGQGQGTIGGPATAGGPALNLQWPTAITNGSGYIYSGGGGGGAWAGFNVAGGGGAGNAVGAGGFNSYWSTGHSRTQTYRASPGGLTHGGGGMYNYAPGGALGAPGANANLMAAYGAGGGGGGASGGRSDHPTYGVYISGGGHALAIQRNSNALTWNSGNTRVYGGVS